MKKNLYVEFRKWIPWWGLGFDSQAEIQQLLDDYNSRGWYCVHFEKIRSQFGVQDSMIIGLVYLFTLGCFQMWGGCAIIFEKDDSPNVPSTKESIQIFANSSGAPQGSKLEEWKKRNPHKSINDFYRENS